MADPQSLIDSLDDALASAGMNSITLRRVVSGAPVDLQGIPASVRSFESRELTGGVLATDSKVIISPTQIRAAGWPNAAFGSPDPELPRPADKVVIGGRVRDVKSVNPIYVGSVVVRIEMAVRG